MFRKEFCVSFFAHGSAFHPRKEVDVYVRCLFVRAHVRVRVGAIARGAAVRAPLAHSDAAGGDVHHGRVLVEANKAAVGAARYVVLADYHAWEPCTRLDNVRKDAIAARATPMEWGVPGPGPTPLA